MNKENQQLNQDEIIKETDMISSLIHEYLYKKEYNKTLDVFQNELSEKIKSEKYFSMSFKEINDTILINSFNTGNKIEFFQQWNRMIPNHMKLNEPAINRLDFFLEIYFAIYPILGEKKNITPQIQQKLKQNMEDFKKYLDNKEIELSKTTEFLAYYALPYVPNPKNHPSYQQLFKQEWVNGLKEKIKECISNYLPSPTCKYPVLYDLMNGNEENSKLDNIKRNYTTPSSTKNMNQMHNKDNNNNSDSIENSELKIENAKLIEEIKKIKLKEERSKNAFVDSQRTWTNLASNIITWSFNLVDLYKKRNNNEINPQVEKINKRLMKYQNFLKKNAEELEKNKNNSNIMFQNDDMDTIGNSKYEDSIINQNQSINQSLNGNERNYKKENIEQIINQNDRNTINESIQQGKSIQIDYEPSNLIDMKKFIMALNHKIKVDDNKLWFIFREIRLRIFRRNDIKLRQLTLFEAFYYDIFGTLSKSSNLLHQLLSNIILNLEVMKLLNSIASLNKGRNYLLSKENLIDDIVQCMISEKTDSELRQNCLGAIQKFTLRAEPQNRLIELNVIHYIVDVFSTQGDSLSDYTTEYGLALIMNLSLRKAGREKFESVAEQTLKILLKFMDKDSPQVLTCINGTLYSLLKRQKFKIEAMKCGLDKKLQNANCSNPQLQKQILYILQELNSKPEEEEYDENFEEDINAKDEDDNIYDENADAESVNDEALEEHYKVLGDFIIRNNDLNKIEEEKIISFMNSNPSMCETNINNYKSFVSVSSTLRPQDNNRPLRRPTTPMTNSSMTGTNQLFNAKKSLIRTINSKEDIQEGDESNNIYVPGDSAKAFEKRDKIPRTLNDFNNDNNN